MYYYGGGNSCGCGCGNNNFMPYQAMPFNSGCGCGCGGNNYAIILVLFILLVIVIGSRFTR